MEGALLSSGLQALAAMRSPAFATESRRPLFYIALSLLLFAVNWASYRVAVALFPAAGALRIDMEHVLEVEGLCKRYPGFALENVSFSVPRGYVMGLIGPNGAGKTTTLKTILGLLQPDAGNGIRAFGLDATMHGEEGPLPRRLRPRRPALLRPSQLGAECGAGGEVLSHLGARHTFHGLAESFGLP